jgi:hypothetical protein
VSGVAPNNGTIAGGTSVTISGNNFLNGLSVSFAGAFATNVTLINSSTISALTPAHSAGAVNVVVTNSDGQSGTLVNGFTYVSPPPTGETILLADDFNDNSLNTGKWIASNLFSGFTDANLPALEMNQRYEIGPLLTGAQGSHYNGVRSQSAFNVTNAYCYVEVVQASAANTTADAMLTIGQDVNNYYRIFVEAGTLYVQKRVQGSKATLSSRAYNATAHRYWRIRHDQASGAVVFEVAADNAGVPGSWTTLYSESWNTGSIPLTAVLFELKAGTWKSEANAAGKVIFDNFKAAKP